MERWRIISLIIILVIAAMDLSGIINLPTLLVRIGAGIFILVSATLWIRKEKQKEKAAGGEKNEKKN